MDPEDWKDWRRVVDEQLLALRFAQGRSADTSAALTKQVDGMEEKLDKLLDEVRDMRIGLGQHPRNP